MRTVATRRRFLGSLAVGATGALLAAACGPAAAPTATAQPAAQPAAKPAEKPAAEAKPTAPAAQPAAAGGTAALKLMSWDAPGPVVTEFLGEFDKKNATQTEYVHVPSAGGAYRDKLLTMLAGNVAPDVMLITVFEPAEYASRNQLVELDPLMRRDNLDTADFFEQALQAGQYKSKQYGIGDNFVYKILYYNVDLFEKEGIARPPAEWDNKSFTWAKFTEAALKFTKRASGQAASQYGFAMGLAAGAGPGPVAVMPFVWSNGGDLTDAGLTKITINTPEGVEALQNLQDLLHKHQVAPTPDALATESLDKMAAGGKIGMWWDGPWKMAGLRQAQGLKWDIAPMPAGKGGSYSAAEGAVWSIAQQGKNHDKSWQLLKHLVSPEGQQSMIKRFGFPGSRKSITNSDAFLGVKPPEHTSVAATGGAYAKVLPQVTNWGEFNKAFTDSTAYLVNKGKTGAEVAKLIEETVTPLLAKGRG
jgi:multiple sugar transport system substrate-binding protein